MLPLVLLTILAGSLKEANVAALGEALTSVGPAKAAMIAGAFLVVCLLGIGAFYALSWVVWAVGRFFEGSGGIAAVRQAVAWGLAPRVWTLLYRVPMAIFFPRHTPLVEAGKGDGGRIFFDPGTFAQGCGIGLLLSFVELLLLVWWAYVASRTLGEAHGFSGWKGFATLLVSMISPILIVFAAILAVTT
jgi:hypothetical protein